MWYIYWGDNCRLYGNSLNNCRELNLLFCGDSVTLSSVWEENIRVFICAVGTLDVIVFTSDNDAFSIITSWALVYSAIFTNSKILSLFMFVW